MIFKHTLWSQKCKIFLLQKIDRGPGRKLKIVAPFLPKCLLLHAPLRDPYIFARILSNCVFVWLSIFKLEKHQFYPRFVILVLLGEVFQNGLKIKIFRFFAQIDECHFKANKNSICFANFIFSLCLCASPSTHSFYLV